MAPRYGVEDQAAIAAANRKKKAEAAAQSQFLASNRNRVSPDTLEASAAVAAGVPTIGAPGRPTLQQELAKMTPQDWSNLGKLMGSNKPTTSGTGTQAPPTEAPPSEAPPSETPAAPTAPTTTSNVEAMSNLFADALKTLQEQYGVSQGNINDAIARMEADPYNMANAYAQMQLAPARVAADPLATYMAAAGLSDQQSAAAAQLAQAEADAYQQAMQNVQNVLQQSQQQANLSRMADIGLIRTGAQQDLEQNLNMLRLGLEQQRIGGLTNLQQQNLQNELAQRNAIANQITSIFAGQDVAPESILKLIEAALAKTNTSRWTDIPLGGPMMTIQPVGGLTEMGGA